MDKQVAIGQKCLEDDRPRSSSKQSLLHTVAEKMLTAFGLMQLLSIALFIIGNVLGADRSLSIFLCLSFGFSVISSAATPSPCMR